MHAQNSSRDSQATGSSNLREFRGNQTCENYLRTTLLELLFCFSASPLLVLTILASKFPRIDPFVCFCFVVLSGVAVLSTVKQCGQRRQWLPVVLVRALSARIFFTDFGKGLI